MRWSKSALRWSEDALRSCASSSKASTSACPLAPGVPSGRRYSSKSRSTDSVTQALLEQTRSVRRRASGADTFLSRTSPYPSEEESKDTLPAPFDDSIFSPDASPWDNILSGIEDTQPFVANTSKGRPMLSNNRPLRRVTMTVGERRTTDDMFNALFNAAADRRSARSGPSDHASKEGSEGQPRYSTDIITRLRGRIRDRWSDDEGAEFDRRAEQVELALSDHELLEWAEKAIFAESLQLESAAMAAIEAATQSGNKQGVRDALPTLQSPAYPHLIALLMRTFRDKYRDPHLALAIFEHARRLSIPSYVFGCTTPAYNQLIETRWTCFRDLRGVYEALEEMRSNGVLPDARTRVLTEDVRREIGARNVWLEENEQGRSEVWAMLNRIEKLVTFNRVPEEIRPPSRRPARDAAMREAWKSPDEQDTPGKGWGFGQWPEMADREEARTR